jgi:hypothetical protein
MEVRTKLSFECLFPLAGPVLQQLFLSSSHFLLSPKNVPAFLEAVKKRQKVLSGFGHRVYKTVRGHSPTVGCPDDC